jgi:hypothetical protein
MQNGGKPAGMDVFDIGTSVVFPAGSFSQTVRSAFVNSLFDFKPGATANEQVSYLGYGKNIFQVGYDFSFSFFGEGLKYTYGTLGGTSQAVNLFTDIATGQASDIVQKESANVK